MRTIVLLSGLSSFVGALFVVAGCAPSLSPGAPCDLSSDCSAPLVCRNARCRIACVEARDCGPGLRCVQSNEGPSCTLEREESCDAANPCPGALRCVFGQCRSECITDADCSRDGVCDVDGSCLEPQSGTDASVMRMDAGVSDAPSCTPSTLVCGNGSVESCDTGAAGAVLALTGGDGGELARISHEITGVGMPREGASAVPPFVALGMSAADYGLIGYLTGGAERRAEFQMFPLDRLHDIAPPPEMVAPVLAGRTIALGEHGANVVGFVLVTEPPGAAGVAGVRFLFHRGGILAGTSISSFEPVGIPSGEMTTVGGDRSVGPSGSDLYYIARENKLHDGSTRTPSVGAIDEWLGGTTYRASLTSSLTPTHDYLTIGGSAGSVAILHVLDTARFGLWNVLETEYLATPATIPTDDLYVSPDFDDPIGGPSIVQVGDGSYVIAVPVTTADGGAIRLFAVRCVDGARCEPPVFQEDLSTRTNRRPEIVRLVPLRGGYALASIEPNVSGRNAAYLYLFDSNWDDVSADTGPVVAVPTLETEDVAAIQIGSVSDDATATLLVAVLVRDEVRTQDRIWLGGYRACITR